MGRCGGQHSSGTGARAESTTTTPARTPTNKDNYRPRHGRFPADGNLRDTRKARETEEGQSHVPASRDQVRGRPIAKRVLPGPPLGTCKASSSC